MTEADITQMVSDLRRFSAELLETASCSTQIQHGTLSGRGGGGEVLRYEAEQILSQARGAWDEFGRREVVSRREMTASAMPTGAGCGVRPQDWQTRDGRMIPTRWQVPALESEPDIPCLRWLLYAIGVSGTFFRERHKKLTVWIDDARRARVVGDSYWARNAEAELDMLLEENLDAIAQAERLTVSLQGLVKTRVSPSSRLPTPFPRSAKWISIRRHVSNILKPFDVLPSIASCVLVDPISISNVPILYQRWTGVKILRSLEHHGWVISGDSVGAIWLGGRIKAIRDGATLHLEIETRYVNQGDTGPSAELECVFPGDLTPDFVFIFNGPLGRNAWVLDATLSFEPQRISQKQQKYMDGLRMMSPTLVAGIPTFPRPSRSWIIGPSNHGRVVLGDDEGKMGYLGFAPASETCPGLSAWVRDLTGLARR